MKLRSRLACAIAGAIALAAAAGPAASAQTASFSDVAGMTWALPSIQAVSLLGVMQGTGAGLFDPSGTTTRAELAVVLARLLRWPTGTQGGQVVQGTSFNDWNQVPDWARTAVAIAASRGILQGESDGGVHPNDPVTWAQLAVIAARTFGYAPAPPGLASAYRASLPGSANAPAWALSAEAADVQSGNFSGILSELYHPTQPVSRAALAVFLTQAASSAGNPDFLSGRVAGLAPGEIVVQAAAGVKAVPVASGALVYDGTAPATLASVRVGDTASVVLVGGEVAWVDVTSRPEPVTVSGSVASVSANGIALAVKGGGTVTLPVSPSMAVTVAGAAQASTVAGLAAGTPVLATLDSRGQLSAIEVTGAPGAVPPPATTPGGTQGSSTSGSTATSGTQGSSTSGSTATSGTQGSSTSGSTATSGTQGSSTSGSTATSGTQGSSTSGSTATSGTQGSSTSGSTATSGTQGSSAGSASAANDVTAITFSPDPIAAGASLTAGESKDVTLTAQNAAGQPVAGAVVQISFSAGPGGGSASIGGTLLTSAAQSFAADASGEIDVVYKAPAAPTGAGSDALVATAVSGNSTVAASDSYVFQPYAASNSATQSATQPATQSATQSAVASYTFAPSPIATAASVAAGQSVDVTLTAEDATGGPVGAAVVYLSFKQGSGGGTAWVGSSSLTSAPQAFLTDSSGHVSIVYTAPASTPSGATDTITAANAATGATLTAQDTYSFGTAASGVAPDGTFTASVQSVSGTGLKLLLPDGSTATLIIAPGATIDENGNQVSASSIAVGEQVTVQLNAQEWIESVQIDQAASAGNAPVAGYLTASDTTAGTITLYGSGGLHSYWLAQPVSVTLAGQAAQVSQIPVGDSLSITLNASNFVTTISASAPTQVTTGDVVTVLSNVLTLSSGSTTQSIALGQYTVAVRNGQLVSPTALPGGTPIVVVPGAATYGGMLIIAGS